ncbi:MAG: hypothetical protein IT357_08720 [Gemmatimonadaceae bacterium]|nr:hypothetical protein [Gemmatimonadaceae bacterium]
MTVPRTDQTASAEQSLADGLVQRIGRLTWLTLAGYALVVILGFALLSAVTLSRSLSQTANVVESLIGLYADPGGERTPVAPAMLADQLVGVGSRFIITRRQSNGDGTRSTYFLTPDMPAKEISGVDTGDDPVALRTALLDAMSSRRWQWQVLHRQVGEFDIFIAGDRLPALLGVATVTLAALLLLPVGVGLARRATRAAVHKSLVPVDRVRRTIAAIGPDDLSQRAVVPTGLAETTEIAMALNHLLARVEGAQRALTAFTADASHELRTPLTFLRAQAQWALDGARSEEALREALISVHAEAERMHRLVEGLLLLARGDNKDLAVERERFDVASIVTEVSEVGSSLIREPDVTVSSEVAAETVVLGDAGHTRQVLLNLVVNAARYTSAGSIRIRAARENELVRLSVEDTGCGIAASDVPRIFERFGRADTSRSREFGGAGLGLAIAKMLAELQGGSLEVESVPGEGSTFSLLLPAAGAVAAS